MSLFYTDFDRRFLDVLQRQSPPQQQPAKMTDADVIREMAEIWVDSGGDSGGLDDEYVAKIRAEIARIEGGAA